MGGIHGGDIYRNHVSLDFSVNINPLGMPEGMEEVLCEAIKKCKEYPDIDCSLLKKAVSSSLNVPEGELLFGNGASELLMAIVHAIKPKSILLPVPSFYGYEYASQAVAATITYYALDEKRDFMPQEDLWHMLTEDTELVFLANPNNPTGRLIPKEYLLQLLEICKEKNIIVVLDECFIEFCDAQASLLPQLQSYGNLLILRAFTKIYAIPGVRLGYLICSNHSLVERIKRQLPEWNLSTFAQMAGLFCVKQKDYVTRSVCVVKRERIFLSEGLKKLGLQVFESDADFILVFTKLMLYDLLLQRGILIRSCENFKGLSKGYYRIAVKGHADNEKLLKAIGECIGKVTG